MKDINIHKINVTVVPDTQERLEKIKDILNRGKIAVFTSRRTGIVKKVDTWNADEDGDLLAFYSTGITNFVCPVALEYEVTEE